VLVAASVVPVVLFYAQYLSWSGDYSWDALPHIRNTGAVPAVAPWLDSIRHKRAARALVAVALSGIVGRPRAQRGVLGSMDKAVAAGTHRVARNPNRDGAAIDDHGRGNCDSCMRTVRAPVAPGVFAARRHWWLARILRGRRLAGGGNRRRLVPLHRTSPRHGAATLPTGALRLVGARRGDSGKLAVLYCALIAVLTGRVRGCGAGDAIGLRVEVALRAQSQPPGPIWGSSLLPFHWLLLAILASACT